MSDDTPILTNQQRSMSIRLRLKAEQQARDATRRYQKSLAAIDQHYRREMVRAGLEVLLKGDKHEDVR